jgi:hypothetical protein
MLYNLNTKLMNEPDSYIVSMRLAQLVDHYGGTRVLAAFLSVDKRGFTNVRLSKSPSIHIQNLMNTYGKKFVSNLYNSIYSLDNTKKAV